MGRRSINSKRKKTWWIVGAAVAAVVLGVTTVGIAVGVNSQVHPRTAIASPTVKIDPSTKSVNLPASFEAWSTNPAVGEGVQADASELGLSARFVVGAPTPIISQVMTLEPNETYTVSATYSSGTADAGLVSVSVGADPPVELAASEEWTTQDFEYTNGGESQVTITFQSTDALDGFRLGAVSVLSEAGTEVVANSEFDVFAAATRITNTSLFMENRTAYLGVSAPVSEISWTVAGTDGVEVLAGTSPAQSGLTLIQLSALKQGFYSVTLSAPEPGLPAGRVSLVVLDEVVPEVLDERLGTTVHIYSDQSAKADELTQILGMGNIRVDAPWALTEVTAGVYDFPVAIDEVYAKFRDRGIHVLPIAAYSNSFYDGYRTPSSAEGIAAYGRFASAVATHYDVDAISVYNEFNHEPFNNSACGRTPSCYMELLAPTADAVRAAHPGTLILGPENSGKDDEFLTGLYQAGGLNYLDVVSFHPYDYGFETNGSPEFLVESLAQANARIAEYNTDGTPPPIWITELGWTSRLTESEAQQGDYLARAQIIALAGGVERFYWYDMINDEEAPWDNISNYGMVHQPTASVPTYEPKPAAAAQAIVARMLVGKKTAVRDELGPDVYSYRFGESGAAVTAAWSINPTTVNYQSNAAVRVTKVTGEYVDVEPVDGIVTIPLGPSPVFLSPEAHTPALAG